jgi:hypothetical protein
MLPPGHLAIGYLAFSLVRRLRHRDVPHGSSIIWLGLATQLPDLIDKPLAWWLGVLPASRSLAHSLLFAIPLVLLVDHWGDRSAVSEPFAVGYLSHLVADAAPSLPAGPELVSFLLWPLLAPPEYGTRPSLWPPEVYFSAPELAIGVAVVVLWTVDGMPGVGYARAVFARLRSE